MYIIILHVTVSLWSRRHGNANSIPYIALNKLALISTWRTFKIFYNFLTTKSKCPEFFKVNQSYVTSFLRDVGCKRSKKKPKLSPYVYCFRRKKQKLYFLANFVYLVNYGDFMLKQQNEYFYVLQVDIKICFFCVFPFLSK